ncbi:glycogen debranching N-terminal domain-containing protein [Streptomyces nanshensis]|uniref:glycogen debranching N-terminal domain-containing protein n=1 Tax=Streptomyces nanshensis TaxID=518642 RepID=UPI0009A05996|nr:glycogen debranching N-terminal domain-containing protein [Streptomyces nanshensis]
MSTMSQPTAPQPPTPAGRQPSAARLPLPAASGGGPAPGHILRQPPPGAAQHRSAHAALICVAAPHLAVSPEHGQLNGEGMEGCYHRGRRVLSHCRLLVAGTEPLPLRSRMLGADQACFTATVPTTVATGPDPTIVIDRLRSADGTERITVRNISGRPLRLPLELRLGTDLAELADIAAVAPGQSGPPLPASVHGAGLAWSSGELRASVSAEPQPDTSLARPGLLAWDWELTPGTARTVVLSNALERTTATPAKPRKPDGRSRADRKKPAAVSAPALASEPPRPLRLWRGAYADGDDTRIAPLIRTALDDANALLMGDPSQPSDLYLAAGAPWRCVLAPAESLRAARMLLPLGTRLAAGTLRTLARSQLTAPGPDSGRLPGPLRHSGPYTPPHCSGTEATLLFPTVLAEARLWGMPECEVRQLVPAAERCLTWMLKATGGKPFVPDPAPDGPYRCEVQASAHRAAVLGAGLLEACGADGAAELREWAERLAARFREEFWPENDTGTEAGPVTVRTRDGAVLTHLTSAAAELLDTGLAGEGRLADGLLTASQTGLLAQRLTSPVLDSGWGLRSLGAGDERHSPFGHRGGAVHVQESVTAIAGLAAAGHEQEAGALLRGMLDAAGSFGFRLPEMYAAEQRDEGGTPLPHPAACRPAAVAAAGAVHLVTALAGVRPDAPAGTVSVHPVAEAPLGALRFAGLRIGGEPFSVRVDGTGQAEVEEASDRLRILVRQRGVDAASPTAESGTKPHAEPPEVPVRKRSGTA